MAPSLTPALTASIVSFIRSGCYDWTAAASAGVPRELFEDWLRRGQAGEEPYRELAAEVAQARAQARAKAEIEAFRLDPLFWLRHGPGRETPEAPGWSTPVKPMGASEEADALASPALLQLLAVLDEALRDHPEARDKVRGAVEALHRKEDRP